MANTYNISRAILKECSDIVAPRNTPESGFPTWKLRELGFERYKGYIEPTQIDLTPLTILVGANNSGKTALAQGAQLLAGGLNPSDQDISEPLPLESNGICHGQEFRDLVSGRAVHGHLNVSATFMNREHGLSLGVAIRNVVSRDPSSQRQISYWNLRHKDHNIVLNREGLEEFSSYGVLVAGSEKPSQQVSWRGLLPQQPNDLDGWVKSAVDDLKKWAGGVRHLRCPRHFPEPPFPMPEGSPVDLGPHGERAPFALAANDKLRGLVDKWYRDVFGVAIDIKRTGGYFELRAKTVEADVSLTHSGRGLSHVLPVAVTALTAASSGPGVDIIEHPEAELHPAAHAHVADLLIGNLAGRTRPMIIETHSEMLLLRARRWIAESRLPSTDVVVYWVEIVPGRGSIARKITINKHGDMDNWPDGVFIEDYDEILAIRRANRAEA